MTKKINYFISLFTLQNFEKNENNFERNENSFEKKILQKFRKRKKFFIFIIISLIWFFIYIFIQF